MPEGTVLDREIHKDFGPQDRDEATIRQILDVPKQLDPYLDQFLYNSEWIETEVEEDKEEMDPITKLKQKVPKKVKRGRYRHLPTEEKIIGCRVYGVTKCDKKNFLPDSGMYYSIDPDIFDGFCVTYVDNEDGDNVEKAIVKLKRLQKHLLDDHNLDIPIEDLAYNARWLTWNAMFNKYEGFYATKSYILMHLIPLVSTSIIPESKSKMADNTDQMLLNQAADDANANLQDNILNHRMYGFSNNPTHIIKLLRFECKLFKLAMSRSINGIAIRGILTSMEERKISVSNENSGSREAGGSVFNKIISRDNR